MRVLCGSLHWLAQSTRPDIATITNILSRYVTQPTSQHIDQAKRVIKYLKETKTYRISFTSRKQEKLSSYIKFPIPDDKITALSDANWGPQDQSKPKPDKKGLLIYSNQDQYLDFSFGLEALYTGCQKDNQ